MFVYSTVVTVIQQQKKTQLKINNGIKKVQPALHQYIAAQMLQFLQRERHEIIKTIQRGKMQVRLQPLLEMYRKEHFDY